MSNRELTTQEKSYVLKAKALNAPFLAVRPTMPMQYWNTFLMIAADEGLSVIEYARRAGLSQSVMSRHILDIGDKSRHGAMVSGSSRPSTRTTASEKSKSG